MIAQSNTTQSHLKGESFQQMRLWPCALCVDVVVFAGQHQTHVTQSSEWLAKISTENLAAVPKIFSALFNLISSRFKGYMHIHKRQRSYEYSEGILQVQGHEIQFTSSLTAEMVTGSQLGCLQRSRGENSFATIAQPGTGFTLELALRRRPSATDRFIQGICTVVVPVVFVVRNSIILSLYFQSPQNTIHSATAFLKNEKCVEAQAYRS